LVGAEGLRIQGK